MDEALLLIKDMQKN